MREIEKFDNFIASLKNETVETWFDIGLFLDKIKDNQKPVNIPASFSEFKNQISKGIAFITFDFGIDGVSIETAKYAKAFDRLFAKEKQDLNIHLIAGCFAEETGNIMDADWNRILIEKIGGFSRWNGYETFFHTKLARGSDEYIGLAEKFWQLTVEICNDLGKEIIENNIKLLVPVNAASNPGNVSLACALAIISEYLDVFILGNHHDFYWEDGKRQEDRPPGEPPGVRDHFFKNAHLGEVFSLIEVLYPPGGKKWFHSVINSMQKHTLVSDFGVNPVSIMRLPTAVDIIKYSSRDETEKEEILNRLHMIFGGDMESLKTQGISTVLKYHETQGEVNSPIFAGKENNISVSLKEASLLFLQPTRIIKRKNIEENFNLINLLLNKSKLKKFFQENPQFTITLLITGPIADGHRSYFTFLLEAFNLLLNKLPEIFQKRVFLACPFGLENKEILQFENLPCLSIAEIYAVSSLTLLPSRTEGRGLPIIESCASGVPIFCNRYYPGHAFKEVIGEDLDEAERLIVFDSHGNSLEGRLLDEITDAILQPEKYRHIRIHNRKVVKNRFSFTALADALDGSLSGLWKRCMPDPKILINLKDAFDKHYKITNYKDDFSELVLSNNRKYTAGYGPIEFMFMLKSLIDPSFFRVEEMLLRGRIMRFAEGLIDNFVEDRKSCQREIISFYNHIDAIFDYYTGEDELLFDHSLSYRHRHTRHYPYRKLTLQELMGVTGALFRQIVKPSSIKKLKMEDEKGFEGIHASFENLPGITDEQIAIDDRKKLLRDLEKNVEAACFVESHYKNQINTLVLYAFKSRLNISKDEKITKQHLESEKLKNIKGISLFARKAPLDDISYDTLMYWIEHEAGKEIKLLFETGFFKIIPTEMLSAGIHLGQPGREALAELLKIKRDKGFVIAFDDNSFMLDMLDMRSYRIGRAENIIQANYMGIALNEAYIQFVPPGLKPSLAYPTPVQTPKEFSQILSGKLFEKCTKKLSEEKIYKELRRDADMYGNPVETVLENILQNNSKGKSSSLFSTKINGVYTDGHSWSGAMAKINVSKKEWAFAVAFTGYNAKTVQALCKEYSEKTKGEISFAWNGGYILNPELVGKLGLSKEYIGFPLGLVCSDGNILSLPLYNKAALVIDEDLHIKIERLNLKKGLTIHAPNNQKLILEADKRNSSNPENPAYYDLLHSEKTISGKNRVVYRLAGNRVVEKIVDAENPVNIIPVGLIIAMPVNHDFQLKEGDILRFELPGLENITQAVEAGPLLVSNGKISLNMATEGWQTDFSIATQAARIDYTNMRGPKIGVGLSSTDELIVAAINGRIRESVGSTHMELAEILIDRGAVEAMGFDPGGSVTLIVEGEQINISPFNKDYEKNIYSLPPQGRTVGNAVLGYKK